MELSQLIGELADTDLPILDRPGLVAALHELDRMVGMVQLKSAVVDQLLFLLANIKAKGVKAATDGHVLHTLIYGPPGVGKTVVGSILARIWASLGVLTADRKPEAADPISVKLFHDNLKLTTANKLLSNKLSYSSQASEVARTKVRKLRNCLYAAKERDADAQPLHRLIRLAGEALTACNESCDALHPLPDETVEAVAAAAAVDSFATKVNFKVVSRINFVGEFVGQTAPKAKKLLEEHRGGVLLVDEAYSLYQGDRDNFGAEALTVINQYMTEHSDSTVLIFAGYKEIMQSSIFKVQPGLARRFAFTFEIPGYTAAELAQIFQVQLQADGWLFNNHQGLVEFFTQQHSYFPSFGGDTKRLIFQCKLVHASRNWQSGSTSTAQRELTLELLQAAFTRYKTHQPLNPEKFHLLDAQRTYEEELLHFRIKEFNERKQHQQLYEQQQAMERQQLQRRIKEETERNSHDELYAAARDLERKELQRRLEKSKAEQSLDERFKSPPDGMYN